MPGIAASEITVAAIMVGESKLRCGGRRGSPEDVYDVARTIESPETSTFASLVIRRNGARNLLPLFR